MNDTTLLSFAGVLIFILLGVVAYFLKGRDKRIKDLEGADQIKTKEMAIITGNLDVISKRLGAGADSFKEINAMQKGLQETQTYILTHYVQTKDLEKYEDKHDERHERIDHTIDGIKESVAEMKSTMAGMDQKLTIGLKTMTDMIAKVVSIPTDPGDKE